MATVAGYVTANELAEFLGFRQGQSVLSPSASTMPSLSLLETIISSAEEYIERNTYRNWRSTYLTVSDEYHSWDYQSQQFIQRRRNREVILIELNRRHVQSITKLEVWTGDSWNDLVQTGTLGEAALDGDYWFNPLKGRVYVRSVHPAIGPDNVRITYKYGEYVSDPASDIPAGLRLAVMYLAGAQIMETHAHLLKYTVQSAGLNYGFVVKNWREQANEIINEYAQPKAIRQLS